MRRAVSIGLVLSAFLGIAPFGLCTEASAQTRVVSERTVTGLKFPESAIYDPKAKVLYVGQFGELKPAEKDGKGKISRVSLDGKILDEQFLPTGGDVLNKPKGMWVEGNRLWVTDIDVVWVFDLQTRRGRKAELPGMQFANDLAVKGNVLYVTDNRNDHVYRVEPADFLEGGAPKVAPFASGKSLNPNGIYPAKDGSLLVVGFMSPQQPRGIYALGADGQVRTVAKDLGRLDGIYEMQDGSLLVTEWNSATLARWSAGSGMQPLASGFKGPADFCVVPTASGLLVVVPDLVKSELRLVELGK
jgi:sugar lactone lactonase YvrE